MSVELWIEQEAVKRAKIAGWLARKLQWIGRRGAPDRVFMKDGRTVWIEFKAPNGALSGNQKREIRRMRDAGQEVYVADNLPDALEVLEIRT